MGLSFGALAVVVRSSSPSGGPMPTTPKIPQIANISYVERVLVLVEPRSLLLAVVFLIVSFILAYLTNPSEASFRTHLTELAFRRHLSRLYDADTDTEHHQHESTSSGSGLHIAAKRQPALTKHPSAPVAQNVSSSKLVDLRQPKQSSRTNGDVTVTMQALGAFNGFHFANRATIGMRTPGHVFRSLGLCTIAAIPIVSDDAGAAPITAISTHKSCKTSDPESPSIGKEPAEVTLAGKWFIGAFGKWWLGGTLQLRQQSVTPGSHPNPNKALEKGDRFTAGVLSFRALDLDPITEGLVKNVADSFSAIAGKVHKATAVGGNILNGNTNGSPNSRNNRTGRRAMNTSATLNVRSSSPPPLPKSASLPLHSRAPGGAAEQHASQNAVRNKLGTANTASAAMAPTSHTNNITMPMPPTRPSQHSLHDKSPSGSIKLPGANHTHSTSNPDVPAASQPMALSSSNASHASVASTMSALDSSPIIVDILRQLHASQEDVAESRNQLALFLSSSQTTNEQSQGSLNTAREAKRREDAERAEAKGRLKSLEDAKRHADAAKREAERRLRTALTTRDRVSSRVEQLGRDVDAVQKKMQSDAKKMIDSAAWREAQSAQLKESMEKVRGEIKVAEDVIAALVLRGKELEEQIQEEKNALARVEAEAAENRKARAATATAAAAAPSIITQNLPPSNDDLNHPIVLRPEQQNSPVISATFPLVDPLAEPLSPAASPRAPSSHGHTLALSLYPPRHPSHEHEVPGPSLEARSTRHHRHTLSLTGNDDVIVASGHGQSGSQGSSKHPSPIGSLPSIFIPTSPTVSLEESPSSRPSRPFPPNGRSHHFSPFADSGPISPFTSSLIPSGLLSSLDESGITLRTSPTSVGMEDFTLSYPLGRQSHRNSAASSGPTLGAPFVWQRPSPAESISRQSWDERIDNANMSYSSASPASTDVLYASPPASRSSFGATSVDFSAHSPDALSSESLYRSDPEPVQSASKRRWFHSASSAQGAPQSGARDQLPIALSPKTRKESNLNPDAKVFRFTRGRSFAFPTRNGNIESTSRISEGDNRACGDANAIGEGRPRGSLSVGSLNAAAPMPPPSTNPASFLSSLLAFTPSAEERAALQRALGHTSTGGINPTWNCSAERLGSDQSPSPTLTHDFPQARHQVSGGSSRSSYVDLTGATGPIWADLYMPRNPEQHQPPGAQADGNAQSPAHAPVTHSVQSKRTFSSLWNRKKSSGVLSVNNAGPTASAEDGGV